MRLCASTTGRYLTWPLFEVASRDGPLIPARILVEDAPQNVVDGPGGHGRHLWFFLNLFEWMAGAAVEVAASVAAE